MTVPRPLDVTFAPLTAPAPGAIAVVGLQGSDAARLAADIARLRDGERPPPLIDDRLYRCRIVDGPDYLDDAIVVAHDGGTVVEICIHGGPWIVRRLLDQLEQRGGRRVAPEDWPGPGRAADETVREIDAALLNARTRAQTRWLLGQRTALPRFLEDLRAGRVQPDPGMTERARAAVRLVRGLRVALVGPPNAGKSTLANRLIGRERVITSDLPGTTRDWVSETAVLGGWPVTLTDTAGLRSAEDPLEREAIRRGLAAAGRADLALVVFDAVFPCEGIDPWRPDAGALPGGVPQLRVCNKIDLLKAEQRRDVASWPGQQSVGISARTGEGIDVLEAAVVGILGLDLLRPDLPTPVTARQCAMVGLSVSDPIGE